MKTKRKSDFLVYSSILSVMVGWLSGCNGSYKLEPSNTVEKKEVVRSMDAIKWIHEDIENPQDAKTYSQDAYRLEQKSRLLMKYESFEQDLLKDKSSGQVILRVTLVDSTQRDLAFQSLKVCALKTNWMMLATWKKAHPFRGGEWVAGADFDPMTCSSPQVIAAPKPVADSSKDGIKSSSVIKNSESESSLFQSCRLQMHLCFDVTSWFQNYVSEQGRNAGLVLISNSSSPLSIQGEMGAYGPRLHWLTDIEKKGWILVPIPPSQEPSDSQDNSQSSGGLRNTPKVSASMGVQ